MALNGSVTVILEFRENANTLASWEKTRSNMFVTRQSKKNKRYNIAYFIFLLISELECEVIENSSPN